MLEQLNNLLIHSSPVFWVSAFTGTAIFVIQMITSGDDFDNFKWLSKQAVTGFMMMFGWSGITCQLEFHLPESTSLLISFCVGLLTIYITGYIFKAAKKLHSPGTVFTLDDAIGKEALVYQRIPRDGLGKITISLQQMTHEINAASQNQSEIPFFTRVQVIKKIDDSTVVVAEIK